MTKYYTKEEVEEILSNPSWHCTLYDLITLSDGGAMTFRIAGTLDYVTITEDNIKALKSIIDDIYNTKTDIREIKDGK